MKQLVFIVTFFSLMACSSQAIAGFAIRKQLSADSAATSLKLPEINMNKSFAANAKELLSNYGHIHAAPQRSSSGWEGIVSLVCGVLSLFIAFFGPTALLFSICAIVFGALGLSGHKPHRGMAVAGLVLGIVSLVVMVLVLLLFIAIFAWI